MKINLIKGKFFYCTNHSDKRFPLVLDDFLLDPEDSQNCIEGLLMCQNCNKKFPIVNGIPIIVENLPKYCAQRTRTFGTWFSDAQSNQLKEFLKTTSKEIKSITKIDDRYELEGLYFQGYKWLNNEDFQSDKFLHLMRWRITPTDIYKKLVAGIQFNPEGIALDLGCALGLSSMELAKKFSFVFGIDTSYSFINGAKKKAKALDILNVEFIVADMLNLPFNKHRFDLVFGLNIIEFIPLQILLQNVHAVLKPHCNFVLTSPYDYNRETSFDDNLNGDRARSIIERNGFEVQQKTKKESYLPWMLKINERTYLFYFLDVIESKKISKHKF